MAYTQENRRIAITTPLGKDVLLLRGFAGTEAISQLFHFDLDLQSENDSVNFQDVVGKNVTLRILDADGAERYWNGHISRFSQGSQTRRLTAYRAQMVPWFWFLTRTSDCRIFQHKNVPEIIRMIFKDLGFQDFKLRLHGSFDPRDYCVQYRETDFNFVSRLMEEEGIFYYFEHLDGKHVLVLANDPAGHDACPGQAIARYDFRGGSIQYEDVVTEWRHEQEFRPGAWAQTDYNFETPSTSLAVTVNGKNPYEIYEYPGEYLVRPEGDKLARIRLQEQTVPGAVIQGASGCRHFNSGSKFTLKDHYRRDQNQEYVLTAVRHISTQGDDYESGSGGGGEELTYRNSFECIPFSTPFRPQRVTPAPYVQGCQTAVVVGPAGNEIYTDKYGRVKVQFHWDREGKKDENSSCWIRVSHPWAGQGYGSVSIPRIGQEVIVDFVEGDPDRPVIVGRVYNAEQMPPNGLPAAGMVSGIKSNSTPGGGGYNEMSMDDTKGKEKVTIHAQHDMSETIENDLSTTVVSGNRTLTVQSGTNTETIKGASSHTVQAGSRTVTVTGGDYSATSTDAAVVLHGQGKGVSVQGDVEGVSITGNAKGVDITGNGEGVGITGNGQGVLITGNAEGVGIVGNAKGVGILGNGEGVRVNGEPFVGIEGTAFIQIKGPAVEICDGEITIKGSSIVLSAGTGQITIGASGVDIVGALVKIN